MSTKGLELVLLDVDADLREAQADVDTLEERIKSTSDRIDDLEDRADYLQKRLDVNPPEKENSKRRPALRLVKGGKSDKKPAFERDWDVLRAESESRIKERGLNLDHISINELLDAEKRERIEDQFSGAFALKADLDKYDIWASVLAGTVAAVVDFFIVKIPSDHNYLGEHLQEGSPLTKWLQSKSDSSQHWIADFAERMEKHTTSFDAVKKVQDRIEGFSPRTHRLQTFGHDPLLGLIIGTIDVMRGGLSAIGRDGIPVFVSGDEVEGGLRPPVQNVFLAFWKTFMHMVSDAPTKMGLPPPGFTLLQAFDVGSFGENNRTIGELARFMYLKGYDSRHFLTMSTSVAAAEVVLRGYYFLRRHFDEQYDAEIRYAAEVAGAKGWRFAKHPRFIGMKVMAHTIGAAMNAGKVACYSGNPLAINYAQWLSFLRDSRRFVSMKMHSPSDVLKGHGYANARLLDEGWEDIDVGNPDFPTIIVDS